MTVKELISKISDLLRLDADIPSEDSAETSPVCCDLLSCCNFVADELYAEYALDRRSTVVNAADGIIDVSALKLSKVLSLKDSFGRHVPFKYTANGLSVKRDGRYNLTYAALPRKLTLDSDVSFSSAAITDRIFLYGVVAEYLRINGDNEQYLSWNGKYQRALQRAFADNPAATLPARRWLY